MEPECSNWTWLTISYTRRHEDPIGDTTKEYVTEGNHTADGLCMLMRLAHRRDVHCITEQPGDSYYFKYPKVAETVADLNHKILT
eukprot:2541537-Pyramimonas_sp.AAC.1